jgi:hypothetical protein
VHSGTVSVKAVCVQRYLFNHVQDFQALFVRAFFKQYEGMARMWNSGLFGSNVKQ